MKWRHYCRFKPLPSSRISNSVITYRLKIVNNLEMETKLESKYDREIDWLRYFCQKTLNKRTNRDKKDTLKNTKNFK